MQQQLAKKLLKNVDIKGGNQPELKELIQLDKEQKIYEESKQDTWLKMITKERANLQDKRQRQEEELEKILDTNAVEAFGNASAQRGNPMISPSLKQKL